MSFDQTAYPGAANLLGNVEIPRNIIPLLRSRRRRLDPDGISSVPYYSGANGKTLRIGYTIEVSTVVTPETSDVVLTGNSISTIINDINTFAASHGSLPFQAIDLDGFIAIRNVNPGKTHYLRIDSFTDSPPDDAAPVLGFARFPFPGGISFAGEIAATPGSRSQSNPQTTTLVAKDDTLGGGELNRGFASTLQMVENLRAELARDVVVYRDIPLTFSAHATDGVISARINDDTVRVFYPKFPVGSLPITPKDLNPYHRVLDTFGNIAVQNFHAGAFDPRSIQVSNFFYATTGTPFNTAAVFATWGTPDGGTIVADSVPNKNKHSVTNVTSIVGNIVECASATFVTNKIMAGDPVELTATILQPFDHSGWFSVDAVVDETHLVIRPMAVSEETPNGSPKKPRWLNSTAAGTLRIAVGRFVPAGDLYVALNQSSLVGGDSAHVVRLAIGVPFIQTLTDDRARDLSGGLDAVSTILFSHINASTDAHTASSIGGFTSATSWRDGTTITGANLKATIEDVLTDLKAQATGNSGTGRIGAEVISIGGSTPNTLAQGTVLSQLTALITALQTHVTQSSGAHAATSISYAGGSSWADGTTNPATTVEAQLDKIVTDLGGSGGASKIRYDGGAAWADGTTNPTATVEAQLDKIVVDLGGTGGASKVKYDGGPNWADGTTNPATTVESQLDKIVTDLGGTGGASKIKYDGGPAWADATTNPTTTVEAQLDKIVTDLAASTGSAKIGGAASGTNIAAATLGVQIADLAVNWLKMSRANTVSGAQTFSQIITANGGLTTSNGITFTGGAEEHHPDREFALDSSSFISVEGSASFCHLIKFDFNGTDPVIWLSTTANGNGSGITFAVCPLSRIRVGDVIKSITLGIASSGSANAGGTFDIDENTLTSTSLNSIFSSAFSWPSSGLVTTLSLTPNVTHITGKTLRLRVGNFSTSGTQYITGAVLVFNRP